MLDQLERLRTLHHELTHVRDIEEAGGVSDGPVLRGNPGGVLNRHLEAGKGNDLPVGGDVLVHSIAAVCDNGRLVTCGAHAGETVPINIVELFRKHMTIHGAHLAGRREIAHVLALVAEGNLKPVIDSVHPLKDIQIAAAKTANREAFGKMVLVP